MEYDNNTAKREEKAYVELYERQEDVRYQATKGRKSREKERERERHNRTPGVSGIEDTKREKKRGEKRERKGCAGATTQGKGTSDIRQRDIQRE